MFYSHQLLARKAPLGQIWMAATMHAKINRRKLDKLDIIKICEEILNPSVPMALRLSGILMGGVVIVYKRKVKLLYDDVNRLLVEINEAWRVKRTHDPTLLPKNRNQARYEAVTLPEATDMEIEQSMLLSNLSGNDAKLHRTSIRMQLDDLEEQYIQIDPKRSTPSQKDHQADPANITLLDDLDSCMAGTDLHNRFERFDIDGDEDDVRFDLSQKESQIPSTLAPSPPHELPQQAADGFTRNEHPEEQEEQKTDRFNNETHLAEQQTPRFATRRARRGLNNFILDDKQLIIYGSVYQAWLQDASDIVKRRGKETRPLNPMPFGKVAILMDLPPTTLVSCINNFTNEIHYPASLMELCRKCTREQSSISSSGGKSTNEGQEPTAHSQEPGFYPWDAPEFQHVRDFSNEVHSQAFHDSIEKLMEKMDAQGSADSLIKHPFSSAGTSGQSAPASNPSPGTGRSFLPLDPEVRLPSGSNRSKRRQNSLSANSFGNLDPVEEEAVLHNSRESKLRRLSENGPTPDFELLVETGPTQTPHQVKDIPVDKITETIRTHLKVHFNTPGAPQSESLDQLAHGMNRKKAAQLFYQTCVLASFDYIKVHQSVSYGDISIAKGPKM